MRELDGIYELMLTRLREHQPIKPSTFVHAVVAETELSKTQVRERLRVLVDERLVQLDWSGHLCRRMPGGGDPGFYDGGGL